MRTVRRRVCTAIGVVLVLVGFAFLLGACAGPQLQLAPPATAAPHVPAKIAQPRARVHVRRPVRVPLPKPRPVVVQKAPPAPAVLAPAARAPAGLFVPLKAHRYAPVLASKQRSLWPDAPEGFTLAGLVEQESCTSLKSPRCWDPHAELKTRREYGFGLGQITVAYKADGSERFNKFKELKGQYASLHAWRWEDRYDPGYQLTAIVEMVHGIWRRIPPADGADAQWAFTLNSYNGGLGGLLQDRRYCASSRGCNPKLWFGNIETHSLKSRAPQPGYGGQSWFSITRGYVRNVLKVRRAKYAQFWED